MMLKWGFFISAMLMLGPSIWFLVNDNIWLAALGLMSVVAIVIRSHRSEPELPEAESEVSRMMMRLAPVYIILGTAIFFLMDTDGYDQIVSWILLPGLIILAVWATWVWPAIVHYRADKKIRERKQREAD